MWRRVAIAFAITTLLALPATADPDDDPIVVDLAERVPARWLTDRTADWTLTPERQSLFWRISDANKVTLAGLSAEQQAQAWTQIEGQAAAQAETAGTETDGM